MENGGDENNEHKKSKLKNKIKNVQMKKKIHPPSPIFLKSQDANLKINFVRPKVEITRKLKNFSTMFGNTGDRWFAILFNGLG